MARLNLDAGHIEHARSCAQAIAGKVQAFIADHSSSAIERTILRLYGVDGVDDTGTPLPNRLVEWLQKSPEHFKNGISQSFAAAMLQTGRDAQTTAELIVQGHVSLDDTRACPTARVQKKETELASRAVARLSETRRRKKQKAAAYPSPKAPLRYVIVATGNVYEDRTQARAAVGSGADIIAQIRSTAQSLLDYVPFGPTTEGFGGTYATQANFKIMRQALDEVSREQNRYIRLVNYSSGLCMAEIAACAALEDLDILLNDSMYGILFRDINMQRTFIDQYFSRLICAEAGIMINTGEDNYLTTADAVEQAHTVTASQLINESMAKNAGLADELLGLGHAFEIDPRIENGFLYELAHAQLARQLFPHAPLKYMPPTKHKRPDIFYSHAMDTLFNLASIATGQGIHLAGMLTEAIHTPLMQDRHVSLGNINYVFNTARDLGREIEFKADGLIARRASQVLAETVAFLEEIAAIGLMEAISRGYFANIKRPLDGGKGLTDVFVKGPCYTNPVMTHLEKKLAKP